MVMDQKESVMEITFEIHETVPMLGFTTSTDYR